MRPHAFQKNVFYALSSHGGYLRGRVAALDTRFLVSANTTLLRSIMRS